MTKKTICIYTCNRSEYSRLKSVMSAIERHEGLDLNIIVGGSHLLERYGQTSIDIESDGFKISDKIQTVIEGTSLEAMAKSTGLAIVELTTCFSRKKPDVLLVVGDRYDMLPGVITASYLNIPIAHIQGGEKSGTIDECIRHAVTKFAHLHFPATEDGKDLIIKMGEDPNRIFVTGCPSIDIIKKTRKVDKTQLFNTYPILSKNNQSSPSPNKDYFLVIQHPSTTEFDDNYRQFNETLLAIHKYKMQTLLIYPNLDAGSDSMIKALRRFQLAHHCDYLFCYKHIPLEIFVNLIRYAACIIGNSSTGIRESCYFGTPCVNIGTRQNNRAHGSNVINVDYNREEISKAIEKQMKQKRYPIEQIYGKGNAGEMIADILYKKHIDIQK